jgi:adenylyl cyclase-associated protein
MFLCLCVQVKGKCNAISIDKCQKTGVVFEQVIATCELVNCNSVQVSMYYELLENTWPWCTSSG